MRRQREAAKRAGLAAELARRCDRTIQVIDGRIVA